MCLDRIMCPSDYKHADSGIAYKGVWPWLQEYWSSLYTAKAPFGEWIAADTGIMLSTHEFPAIKYQAGFHLYARREDCQKYSMYEPDAYSFASVAYRGLLCVGWDAGCEVLIAREITVSLPVDTRPQAERYFAHTPRAGLVNGVWYFQRDWPVSVTPRQNYLPAVYDTSTGEVKFDHVS